MDIEHIIFGVHDHTMEQYNRTDRQALLSCKPSATNECITADFDQCKRLCCKQLLWRNSRYFTIAQLPQQALDTAVGTKPITLQQAESGTTQLHGNRS